MAHSNANLRFSFRTQSTRSDNFLNYNLWFYIFVFGFYISARRFFDLPETPPRATLKGRTTSACVKSTSTSRKWAGRAKTNPLWPRIWETRANCSCLSLQRSERNSLYHNMWCEASASTEGRMWCGALPHPNLPERP